jgi:hypothetical protein
MKKLLLLVVILLSFLGYAQREGIEIDREWAELINPYFESLDKDRVPHGVLLDYAMEFTNVPAYNGTLTDSTSVDINVFSNIYKTLLMGRVTPDTTFFPRMETVASQWFHHRNNLNSEEEGVPVLVLSGLYYNYARFDQSALDNGKIVVENNQYHDVYDNEAWQNPYEVLETVAYALPVKNIRGGQFEVVLPEELFLSNNPDEIISIEIDFGDGQGFRELTFGEHLPVVYDGNGVYHWSIRTVKEGDVELFSTLAIAVSGTSDPTHNNVFIPGPNFTSPLAKEGAWLRIDYAPGHNGQIKKPFIVAEGFDPGSILTPEITGGDRTLNDFRKDITLDAGTTLYNLLYGNNRQYDIIYIDWQNGTHNIKHNAEVLRNVITWVNDQKLQAGSTEQNVLLGQSMGGLVGRYALAKMEQDYDEDHDVRLFIAHDSPMRGANTPISTQFFTRHVYDQYTSAPILYGMVEFVIPTFLNFLELMSWGAISINFPSISDALTIQDTPAALQMNYHYVDISSNPTKTPHQIWQQEFDQMGYPQNSRNIAISNGNECAANHGFNPGDKIIDLHETQGFSFWGDLLNMLATPILGVFINDPELIILGLVPGSSSYQYDFNIHTNPLPNSSYREVYYGRIRYKKEVLWIGPTATHAVMERAKDAPVGYLPFDYYSGGYYDIRWVANSLPINLSHRVFANPRYGFIPVASSLDIRKNNNQELNHDDLLKNFSGGIVSHTGLSSGFDNFIVDFNQGNPINNQHISFQTRNGNWLANELDGGQGMVDCSFVCSNLTIDGPSIICGNSVVFSVPQGANSYNWQVQHSSLINLHSGTTGNSITLSQKTNESGWITLSVAINGGACGNVTVNRQVYVGAPMIESIEEVSVAQTGHTLPFFPIDSCDDVGLKLNFAPSFANVQDMEWEKVTNNYQWSQGMSGNSNQYVVIAPQCNGLIKFKVRMKNFCGWSDWQELEYNVTHCSTNCQTNPPGGSIDSDTFVIWPIPASTVLNVKIKGEDPGLLKVGETLTIQIFNNIGIMVKNVNAIATQTAIDVSNLPSGIYTLIITYNGIPESHQIVIG